MANFNSGPPYGDPLKDKNPEKCFLHVREDKKIGLKTNVHGLGPQMADISVNNRKGDNF